MKVSKGVQKVGVGVPNDMVNVLARGKLVKKGLPPAVVARSFWSDVGLQQVMISLGRLGRGTLLLSSMNSQRRFVVLSFQWKVSS